MDRFSIPHRRLFSSAAIIIAFLFLSLACNIPLQAAAPTGQPLSPVQIPVTEVTQVGLGEKTTFTADMLTGRWSETWGVGEQTDVTYHDVYVIEVGAKNLIHISCPERPKYVFEKAEFDGEKLTVTLKNGSYIINYVMVPDPSGDILTGTAETNQGVTAKILWEKIK